MSLPWFRLDTNIVSHNQILALLSDPSPKRWQAAFSYPCAIGWSVDHGTDGHVPPIALPFVHGSTVTARLLVTYRLWREAQTGWEIVNFAERQQLDIVTAGKQEAARVASEKANCTRWHRQPCWTGTYCPIISGTDDNGPPDRSPNRSPKPDPDRTPTNSTYIRTDGEGQDVGLSGSFAERARAPRKKREMTG